MARKYKFTRKPMIVWYGKIFYSTANMGVAFITQTFTGFILFFGSIVCRIPAGLMGLAFSIGALFDAITDPVAGYITDNTKSNLFGKRHGYIMVSTFLFALINVLLWSVPLDWPTQYKFLWIIVSIILLQTMSTMFNTPYNALGVDLAGDYNEQTVIQSFKSVFFLVGTIAPTIIMAVLQANPSPGFTDGRYDPASYINMAYISSIVMLICGFISYMGTYSHVPRLNKKAILANNASKQNFSIKAISKDFFNVIKEKNYRAIIVGYSVSMIAAAFLTGVGMYMFTYTFKVTSTQMYVLLGSLFIATILSQPLWAVLSKAMDKKPALLLGLIVTIVGVVYIFIIFLNIGNFANTDQLMVWLLPAMMFTGIGVGSLYPLPYSIMADAIAYDTVTTNEDKTATFTGFMTFAFKLSQSATLLIIGLALEVIGFKVPQGSEVYLPPRSAELGLGYLFCVGVIVSLILGIYFFSGYQLKKTDIPTHENIKTPTFEVDRLLTVIENKTKTRKK